MVEYRELDETEKTLCKKQLTEMNNRKQYFDYLLEYTDLMIRRGLYQDFKKKLREFEGQKRELVSQIHDINMRAEITRNQITIGVPIKEKKENKQTELSKHKEKEKESKEKDG